MHSQNNSIDFNQLLECLHNVEHNLSIQRIPDKVLLLMGQTKAGKTTLLYYLLKKKLVFEINQMGVMQMKPEAICFNAQIGNGYDSTTVYPNIPTDIDEDQCLIIDMPGFNDTRPMYRFLNIYIILSVIRRIKSLHVSFVIPFESLEGEALRQALENSCLLLSSEFLRTERSFSFILTKIEDSQNDKQTFLDQMEELKENQTEEVIGQVLNLFSNNNTYIFCSSEPDLQEGAKLKKQIIRENNFYSTDQDITRILSTNYADIIIGKGDRQEFNIYLEEVIRKLTIYLPPVINMLRCIVKYQHQNLFSKFEDFAYRPAEFDDCLQQLSRINFGVAQEWCSFRQAIQFGEDIQLELKSFVAKMKKSHSQLQEQNQKSLHELSCLVESSSYLSKQMCGISEHLRETLHLKLKDSYILIQTLMSISSKTQMGLNQQIDRFFKSEELVSAVKSYFSFIQNENFLAIMMELPQARTLMHNDTQFSSIISFYNPKYTPTASEVIFIEEPIRNKIINDSLYRTMIETTKEGRIANTVQPQLNKIRLNQIPLQILQQQIEKLPSNHISLEFLLESIDKMRHITIKQAKDRKVLNSLLNKTVKILSRIGFVEEAASFAITASDHSQVEKLVEKGLKFSDLTPSFINIVLLPYILNIQFDFELLEKIHSFLLLQANSTAQILKIEAEYVKNINAIRKLLDESKGQCLFQRKRFDLQIIQCLTNEEGRALLVSRVKERSQMLRRCIFGNSVAQRPVLDLSNVC